MWKTILPANREDRFIKKKELQDTIPEALMRCDGGADGARTRDLLRDRQAF